MNDLIPSFKDSILNGSKDAIEDLTEVGIDKILDEGLLRDMPFVSLISGTIKTFHNLNDRNLLRQSLNFMKEFRKGTIDEKKLKKYKKTISTDNKKAEEEFGRILLILNNTIEMKKSSMFANLYRNYINEIIDWNELCEFSEIINMMLINDLKYLKEIYTGKIKDTIGLPLYPFDRLTSLGLINTASKGLYPIDPDGSYVRIDKFIKMSKIGGKFFETINLS